jgi:hypothetical protein
MKFVEEEKPQPDSSLLVDVLRKLITSHDAKWRLYSSKMNRPKIELGYPNPQMCYYPHTDARIGGSQVLLHK